MEKISYDVPHQTKGNGIYLLSEDSSFSTNYWHLSQFEINVGDKISQGTPIGLMGNSGNVRPKPTPKNPYNGTHLHFGLIIHGKFTYYKGFVDPVQYMINKGHKLPIYFPVNLYLGSRGDYVSWLQTCLKLEGFAHDYEPIGIYGLKTMRDIRKLQQKYNISATGFCGPKTRRLLMERWSSYQI